MWWMNGWISVMPLLSLKENKSKSAQQSVSLSVSYRTDQRSLALPQTVQSTQLVITGWWAAARLCTHRHTVLREAAYRIGAGLRVTFATRLPLTAWWMTRLTADDSTETCGISSSGVGLWCLKLAAFAYCAPFVCCFPETPEGWRSWQRGPMCKSSSLSRPHLVLTQQHFFFTRLRGKI